MIETEHVGHQRILGDGGKGQGFHIQQRVSRRHEEGSPPAVAGYRHQILEVLHGLGCDAEVHLAVGDQLRDLQRRPHVGVYVHARILARELLDDRRERVAGHGMSRRQGQLTESRIAVLLGRLLEHLHLDQGAVGELDDGLARRRDADQLPAGTLEYLHAQLVFQLADLLADPRLGGEERVGGRGHVQIVPGDLGDVAKLAQVHRQMVGFQLACISIRRCMKSMQACTWDFSMYSFGWWA
jgi:hypothetical protein